MQFARITMLVLTTEIIDTIGDVAGLLDFRQEVACADGMQTTSRQEIEIALMCLVGGNDVLHG